MSKKLKYTIDVAGNGSWENVVINLPVGLTIQERKLHRSCLNYQINGGYVYDTNNNAQIKLGVAPDTWPVRSAIRRARDNWLLMHKELFSNSPMLKPKWHDFKMMLRSQQYTRDTDTYNVPEDLFDNNISYNEQGITWSLFTTENGLGQRAIEYGSTDALNVAGTDKDEFHCHLLGPHISTGGGSTLQYQSIGALESWIRSRPDISDVIEDVSPIENRQMQDDPIAMLFNDGDADNELIDNFRQIDPTTSDMEGDAFPPYDIERPMQQLKEVAAAHCTSYAPISYFTGFEALLGQVFVRVKTTGGEGTLDLLFDVEPKGMKI